MLKKTLKTKKTLFLSIYLLFENKLEKNFDKVLCVIAKKKIRRERVLRNKKFTKKTLQKFLNSKFLTKKEKHDQT